MPATLALPENCQADLEARRIILTVDDLGKDHGRDEVGQRDHNRRQVQYQEVLSKNHPVNFLRGQQSLQVSGRARELATQTP